MWFLRKITSNTNESLCHVKYKGHSTPKRIRERQNGAKSRYSYRQRKLIGWGAAICTHELWEKMKQKAPIRIINGSLLAGGRPSAHITHQKEKWHANLLFLLQTEACWLGGSHLHTWIIRGNIARHAASPAEMITRTSNLFVGWIFKRAAFLRNFVPTCKL